VASTVKMNISALLVTIDWWLNGLREYGERALSVPSKG